MDKQELSWDEELIRKEADLIRRKEAEIQQEEIVKRLKEKETGQKSVSEYYEEIGSGFTEINGAHFRIEKQKYFDNRILVPVLADDVESIKSQEDLLIIIYKQLEMSLNLAYLKEKSIPISHDAYQQGLVMQIEQMNRMYEPLESGVLKSGNKTFVFSSGITESEIGHLFNLNFFHGTAQHSTAGSFTCRLREQYSYQNLFKAMIQYFYETEVQYE